MNKLDKIYLFRLQYRSNLSKWYNPYLHLLLNFLMLFASFFYFSYKVGFLTITDIALLMLLFIFGDLIVWLVHYFPLHKNHSLSKYSFEKHTVEHHGFFSQKEITYDFFKDYSVVLFPMSVVLFFTFVIVPVLYFLSSFIFSEHIAYLICSFSTLYFILYEFVHWSCHQESGHFVLKIGWIYNMKKLHQLHHNPVFMSKYNFGIVSNIFDHVFRTYKNPDRL